MNLEQQVCSLELAKKLKELGVKQESLFWWGKNAKYGYEVHWGNRRDEDDEENGISDASAAFTVAELGEMLPEIEGVPFGSWHTSSKTTLKLSAWCCDLVGDDDTQHLRTANTEADARAKMLIYLIENQLITI